MDDEQESAPAGPLAEALAASMRERDVKIGHVIKHSGLVRNTIMCILTGQTMQPKATTLTRVAVAIATNDYTREVDRTLMRQIERKLSVAAGYSDPDAREASSLLEMALTYVLASRERARAWASVIIAMRKLSPDVVRTIPGLLGL